MNDQAHRLGHVRESLADGRMSSDAPTYVRVIDRSRRAADGLPVAHEYPITGGLTGWADGHVSLLAEGATAALTFDEVSRTNALRAARWHPGFPSEDSWSGADWSNAMAGEAGETCNVVKKLRRYETNLGGRLDPGVERLRADLAEEIADTFIYLDLLATKYGVDLPAAVVAKFNKVSEREGFPERLQS